MCLYLCAYMCVVKRLKFISGTFSTTQVQIYIILIRYTSCGYIIYTGYNINTEKSILCKTVSKFSALLINDNVYGF